MCNEYLKAFCERHEYEYDPDWVGGDIGTIAIVGDYFVSMDVIRYDVDNNIDEKQFLKWYDYTLLLESLDLPRKINYSSWCKGAPLPYNNEQIEKIREAHARVELAKSYLEDELERLEKDAF